MEKIGFGEYDPKKAPESDTAHDFVKKNMYISFNTIISMQVCWALSYNVWYGVKDLELSLSVT